MRRSSPAPPPEFVIQGAPRTTLRDAYHLFLRVRWSVAVAFIVGGYLTVNLLFAVAFDISGGVANARPGSLFDAFCFSAQTMGTIGYGNMYPTSVGANLLVIAESVTSLLSTAVATGLVFTKFARSTARVAFARHPVIGPMDGAPTLMLRVGNERGNTILEATTRVSLVRTEHLREGTKFYRMYDLRLARERSPAMSRAWTILHPVGPDSPLQGATPESLERDEVEILVTVVGVDDTSLQPVHARHRYVAADIVWGARHADILHENEAGTLIVDLTRFHDVVPTLPFDGFPYPVAPAGDGPSCSKP